MLQSQRDIVPDPDTLFATTGNVTGVNGASLDPRLDALAGRSVTLAGVPIDPAARGTLAAYANSPGAVTDLGVGTQNGPRYTLRFCRAFDGAHLAKRSERGGWRIGIGPEVIAGEIDMLPTER